MTSREREIIDIMERREIAMLCVHETKGRDEKAEELENGYKNCTTKKVMVRKTQ